jgi:hypothetical protein
VFWRGSDRVAVAAARLWHRRRPPGAEIAARPRRPADGPHTHFGGLRQHLATNRACATGEEFGWPNIPQVEAGVWSLGLREEIVSIKKQEMVSVERGS